MSGHQKTQEQALYDYNDNERTSADASFQFPQPSPFAAQIPLARAQQSHGTPISVSEPYSTSFLPYASRDEPSSGNPYIASSLQPLPIVISHSPLTDTHGSKVRVRIKASYELSAPPALTISFMFGQTRRQALVKREQSDAHFHHYTLESDIPPFDLGQSPGTHVPLYIQFQDDYGNSLGTVEVGDFAYSASASYTRGISDSAPSRKRKQSAEPLDHLRSPPKRSASQQFMERIRATPSSHPSALSPQQTTPYLRSVSSAPYALSHQALQHDYNRRVTAEQTGHYTLTPYTTSHSLQSPGLVSSMYSHGGRSSSFSGPQAPATMTIGHPSSSSSSIPTLVRTSSMATSSAPPPISGSSTQTFNPYAMYPNSKAVLKMDGDLDKMAEDWSQDEWEAKRRLVQFQRNQSGSTITATFKPVTLEERTPGSICISCIWWEERSECFVTSVDTIYLLESLVAVKFTVEEKNRIRRNLEGFRPLTVSKAKADSEEFFKVVMGFPNPKPRNIEKDVKVFPWKILSHALKKIIGKYSASYASTASALPPPTTSGYASNVHAASDVAAEHQILESPSSATSSATSAYRGRSMTTTAASPSLVGPTSHAGPIDVRGSAGIQHAGHMRPHDYLGLEMSPALPSAIPNAWAHQPQMQHYTTMGTGRQSLDLATYLPDGSAAMNATPGPAQSLQHYYRTYPGSMHGTGQEAGQNLSADTYDLYASHATAQGTHQQASNA